MKKNGNGKALGALLGVLLMAVVVTGTIAYMTSTSSVTNTFVKGSITEPENKPDDGTTDKEDGGSPTEEPDDDPATNITGNIYENYEQNSKIGFNSSVKKIPFVGLGKNSEKAYVFAKVDNKVMAEGATNAEKPYFVLGEQWKAVDGAAEAVDAGSRKYVSGLFAYVGNGTGDAMLVQTSADNDVYTTPLFKEVVLGAKGTKEIAASPTMDVSCFIYAPTSGESASDALAAAQAWAQQ